MYSSTYPPQHWAAVAAMPVLPLVEVDVNRRRRRVGRRKTLREKKNHRKRSPPHRKGEEDTTKKTEMCNNFLEFGTCRYGQKCRYAHGQQELKQTFRGYGWKRVKCRNYHGIGICMFGVRCNFIHDESEEELAQIRGEEIRGRTREVQDIKEKKERDASLEAFCKKFGLVAETDAF